MLITMSASFSGFATYHPKKHPSEINGADAQVLEDRSSREARLFSYHHLTSGGFERGTEIV